MARGATEKQREAARLALADGASIREAADRADVNHSTVTRWRRDNNWPAPGADGNSPQTAAARASFEERRLALAHELFDDVALLRAQLFAPTVERKAFVVPQGKDNPSEVEQIDVNREQPTFTDQRAIMTSIGIAVDKAQVLTGAASVVYGSADQVPEPAKLQQAADELAARRAS